MTKRHRTLFTRGLFLITAFTAGLLAFGTNRVQPAEAAYPGANGLIVFQSYRDGLLTPELYSSNPDGSNPVRLTNNTYVDAGPVWSPDGTKIAFHSLRNGSYDIYVMDADGSNETQLTFTNPANEFVASWSPDGTKLAFDSNRNGDRQIFIMNADGSNQTAITPDDSDDDFNPSWSPDGTRIAFQSTRDGNDEIYIMDADGANPVNLSQSIYSDMRPDFSPDGTQILYTSNKDGIYNLEIYVMQVDGSLQTRLTNTAFNNNEDQDPSWSPDGTQIVFESDREGLRLIFVMDADGENQTLISNQTNNPELEPDWQPIPATLTIVKETDPVGGTDFPFTIDTGLYTYDFEWGNEGDAEGEFYYPSVPVIDSDGNVYVTDTSNYRIEKFDSDGNFLLAWGWGVQDGSSAFQICTSGCEAGIQGSGTGQFDYAYGIAVDASNNVYVADTFNNRIQVFDSDGNYVSQIGTNGSSNGELSVPRGVAVDAAGNVYVADTGNVRMQKFDSSGNYITQWGSAGNGESQFNGPDIVALDAAGNLYVTDGFQDRVQVFDSDGNFLRMWGWGVQDGSNALQVCTSGCTDGIEGSGIGQFYFPFGIAIDANDNVFVVNNGDNRVQVFDTSGNFLAQWGSYGTGATEFDGPNGVAVDAAGNVYVVDGGNHRVQVFSLGLQFTLDDGQSETYTLVPGSYQVSEAVPDPWTLGDISCDGGSPNYGATSADLTLAGGDDVTCTFLNTMSFCPTNNADVGYLRTDLIGTGQGSPTKGQRTRKLVIPNYQDVDSLYGQLAAVDVGVMKFVRFRYPNGTKVQIKYPTSLAYRTHAISWWGSDLTPYKYVKGQFFWGSKGNKSPRAFVLWPTYNTTDEYANVLTLFDESTENHVYWDVANGWIKEQTQTIAIPETQFDGADVRVQVALVDNLGDDRPVILEVSADGIMEQSVTYGPDSKDLLNLIEVVLEDVPAGTDEVVLHLYSPDPFDSGTDWQTGSGGGDSAAMIGASAGYECGGVPAQAPTSLVTLEKVLDFQSTPPQDPWNFDVTYPDQSTGSLQIDPAGGSVNVLTGQFSGEFTITETQKQFWEMNGIDCTTGDTSNTNSITFTVDPGEDVTCTFHNLFPQ
ncbi:MAG: 6-bladed beta-propeller [Chloroflexota bacterium]